MIMRIDWANEVSGLYTDASKWTGGVVPGPADFVDISFNGGGTPFTVTSNVSETVAVLAIGPDATFDITGGAFTILGRSPRGGTSESLGTINVGDNASFVIDDSPNVIRFNNLGTLALGSTGDRTSLIFGRSTQFSDSRGTLALSANENNVIEGATASVVFLNGALIVGSGQLGAGQLTLHNGGVIDADNTVPLAIDTGANAVANSGLIETTGVGNLVITSAVNNALGGKIETHGGVLEIEGAVTTAWGSTITISGGTLDFGSSFTGNVTFAGAGVLGLAQSQTYTGIISGFSTSGADSLDLGDIGFGSSTKVSYNRKTFILTVTDGIHTAHIDVFSTYPDSRFSVSSDGKGGVIVTDVLMSPVATPPAHPFIAAMAGLGGAPVAAIHPSEASVTHPSILARPHTALA